MGQKSEVIIFRYVTQNTVEQVKYQLFNIHHAGFDLFVANSVQNVVNLQKRKSGLAKFTLGTGSADNISNTLQVSKHHLSFPSRLTNSRPKELETVLDLRPQKRSASEM